MSIWKDWFKKKPPQPGKGMAQYGCIFSFEDKEVFIPKGAKMVWKVNEKGEYDGKRYVRNKR